MKTLKVRIKYFEELLGTNPANPDIYSEFIANKAPDAESREQEIAAIGAEEYEEKAMTVFARNSKGIPINWDYQWKGYFKDACGMLRRVDGYKSKKLTSYKKVIDGLVFVYPREIPLVLPKGGYIGSCQRPLRASTAQGDRVALANSETVPPGTTQEFEVRILQDSLLPTVIEWLTYGELHGTGQWRNSGKGRFYFAAVDDSGKVYSNMPTK